MKILFISLLIMLFPFIVGGQGNLNHVSEEQAVISFEKASFKHKRQLRNLVQSRGVSREFYHSVITINEIREVLKTHPPESTLLLYNYEDEFLQVYAISAKFWAWSSSKVSKRMLASQINSLRQSLGLNSIQSSRSPRKRGFTSSPKPSTVESKSLKQAEMHLSRTLFPTDVSKALSLTEHLIVVPVLGIGTVPFPLLHADGMQQTLIDYMDIRIAPSLFDLDQPKMQSQNLIGRGNSYHDAPIALVLGNPAFGNDPDWALPALPGAEKEAHFVAKVFKTTAFVGQKATYKNISNALRDSDLVYLATHGVADDGSSLDKSFIALTPDNENKLGRWTAREIQSEHLKAKLVVLSACQTGLGRVHDAGVIGLARAFQIAGASQVVMSLWNVSDEATEEMMRTFISYLKEGMTPQRALRSAMLKERELRPDPG